MPLIQIQLFPGRSDDKKSELARAITKACQSVLGAKPEDVEILFSAIEPRDWFVAGESYASPIK